MFVHYVPSILTQTQCCYMHLYKYIVHHHIPMYRIEFWRFYCTGLLYWKFFFGSNIFGTKSIDVHQDTESISQNPLYRFSINPISAMFCFSHVPPEEIPKNVSFVTLWLCPNSY